MRKTARIAKILIFSENMKLITKSVSAVILAVACLQPAAWAQNPTLEGSISVKSPGNPAVTFSLSESHAHT